MAYDNAAEEIEAMLNGTHNGSNESSEPDVEDYNEEDYNDDTEDYENNENYESNQDGLDDESKTEDDTEDTGQEDNDGSGDEENTETNTENDGSENDTDGSENDEADENIDGNSQEDDNSDEDGDGSETNDENDGSTQETATIDPNEYAKLKSFYETVTGEFKANGKTIKGFSDPEKIVQGLQKAIGFEEKNAALNKHKKFLAPLRDKGFLDDPDKFNLAMSIMDGDPEANKKHLKALEINPVLDLDLDEIKYMPKQHIASESKVILDDAFDTAESYGVKDKLSVVLGSEFDDDSFQDFIKFPKLRNDLITHIQDGTYDLVKEKIDEIRLSDITGDFKSAKTVDQYRFALEELTKQFSSNKQENVGLDTSTNENNNSDKAVIKNTADKIMSQAVVLDDKRKAEILAEEEEKYRAEASKLAADKARKEAASVSKTKTSPKSVEKKEEFNPLELEGDEFRNYFNTLMR